MPTPQQEIKAFLSGGDADDSRRLDVATLFAQSMLKELRTAVAEWEATAATIERAHASRRRRDASASRGAATLTRSSGAPGGGPNLLHRLNQI
jgi:hypothetical protein